MPTVHITEFTDPGCPWAFSAEPMRRRLDWLFGDQLAWTPVMVGLAENADAYEGSGFTTQVLSQALKSIGADHGMPIDSGERPRMAGTVPACRAVIAARLHAPTAMRAVLRSLRVRSFAGELLDAPETLAAAATDAGLDPDQLAQWTAGDDVTAALAADMDRARHPLPGALALNHKLAGWEGGRRYTCPSYELARDGRPETTVVAAGFQPLPAYEVLLANLAPELERRATTGDVAEVLAWAGEPLATKEVAMICELDVPEARERLARVADEHPVGADGYWSLAA
jgi:predicted DsbA family dithiol-disulfide isomerase